MAISAGGFYKPELDSLRFFAFMGVFVHHTLSPRPADYQRLGHFGKELAEWAAAVASAGGFGVDLFFALSSYLITELLLREIASRGAVDVRAFYIRRALRIWPLYLVFLTVALGLSALVPSQSLSGGYATAFALFVGNWACAAYGYPASVAAPLWSVSIEEQFYITWPLLVRTASRNRVILLAVALLVIASATRLFLLGRPHPHPAVWCNTLARLDPIAGGALLAVLLRGRAPRLGASARVALAMVGAMAMVAVARYADLQSPASRVGLLLGYPVVAASAVVILLSVLRADGDRSFLAHPWLVYVGRISYGLYVFHLLGLLIADRYLTGHGGFWFFARIAFGFTCTLALAGLSYRFLESPFLRLKARYTHVQSRSISGVESTSSTC